MIIVSAIYSGNRMLTNVPSHSETSWFLSAVSLIDNCLSYVFV